MIIKEILQLYDLLDRPGKVAEKVCGCFVKAGQKMQLSKVKGSQGETDFVKVVISGKNGKSRGGKSPTLGIIGRLGGIGARPERIGFVSDGDGALTALSVGLRLARMQQNGDKLNGDVIITTHMCTDAPTEPHEPVPFMGSPVEMDVMNQYEVDPQMDAILSIDTSRGNRIIKTNSFAISPTVKEGWILKVSDDLVCLMEQTTGDIAKILPISMQDITPYGNNVYHFNSIMQPAVATTSPVVGVALTSILPVAGCATGITNAWQLDLAGRFIIESAISFTSGQISFYDQSEFQKLLKLYGKMNQLSTYGNK